MSILKLLAIVIFYFRQSIDKSKEIFMIFMIIITTKTQNFIKNNKIVNGINKKRCLESIQLMTVKKSNTKNIILLTNYFFQCPIQWRNDTIC